MTNNYNCIQKFLIKLCEFVIYFFLENRESTLSAIAARVLSQLLKLVLANLKTLSSPVAEKERRKFMHDNQTLVVLFGLTCTSKDFLHMVV